MRHVLVWVLWFQLVTKIVAPSGVLIETKTSRPERLPVTFETYGACEVVLRRLYADGPRIEHLKGHILTATTVLWCTEQ